VFDLSLPLWTIALIGSTVISQKSANDVLA
jgi:hypothetical protein